MTTRTILTDFSIASRPDKCDANLVMQIWSRLNYEMQNLDWTNTHVRHAWERLKRQFNLLSWTKVVVGISKVLRLKRLQLTKSQEADDLLRYFESGSNFHKS